MRHKLCQIERLPIFANELVCLGHVSNIFPYISGTQAVGNVGNLVPMESCINLALWYDIWEYDMP